MFGSVGLPGVKAAVPIEDAVALVADNTWRARQAVEKLPVTWSDGANANASSASILADLQSGLERSGKAVQKTGDAPGALAGAAKRVGEIDPLP